MRWRISVSYTHLDVYKRQALAWGLKGWDLRRVTAKCFRENHPSRHMLAACMDPTGEDETYFYFEKCIQNENDMHMDILSE